MRKREGRGPETTATRHGRLMLGLVGLGLAGLGLALPGARHGAEPDTTTRPETTADEGSLPAMAAQRGLSPPPEALEPPPAILPGAALDEGISVAAATKLDGLAVYPIYSRQQATLPAIAAIHEAVAGGRASIREVANGPAGAEVHELVFDNDGDRPLLALGGSMLAGGFQDRFITRDFIVEPEHERGVHVHCGELHRWSPTRNGEETKGRFRVMGTFAGSFLHGTAELTQDQSKVWKRVDAMNAAHCKAPATATIAATLEDPKLLAAREKIASQVARALAVRPHQGALVGLAYEVNGDIRGVRIFADHDLYQRFVGHLTRTAAFEAMAERGASTAMAKDPGELSPEARVVQFVDHIRHQADEAKTLEEGRTKTVYLFARRGYGAVTRFIPDAESKREVPLTMAFVKRPGEAPARRSACL
ncbi:MAG: DUF6569 family protein [Polyangiaceae bacterium]